MDAIIIRAYELKLKDIFKKLSTVYVVNQVDDTGIYYAAISNKNGTSDKYAGHFGTASHEKIELLERSNFKPC